MPHTPWLQGRAGWHTETADWMRARSSRGRFDQGAQLVPRLKLAGVYA